MNEAESQALELAQATPLNKHGPTHRFTAAMSMPCIGCGWVRFTLGRAYRSVNLAKGGFQFANSARISNLMREMEKGTLRRHTPCHAATHTMVAHALAEVHAELILVHPFRDGNWRLARLLALLMALQAGLPPLDFSPLAGRAKRAYIGAIHAAMERNYAPLAAMFGRVIERSRRRAVSNRR